MIPDIDALRKVGVKPFYFGLGFIQCKVTPQTRYHFWHPELTPIVPEEQIHDHRYSFLSTVVKGSIIHETFSYTPNLEGDWEKIKVSCNLNDLVDYNDLENQPVRCDIKLTGTYTLIEGSSYNFSDQEFHKTKVDSAITFLYRQPTIHRYAQVIKPINEPNVCPFEKKIPEKELWEMIESMLK